MLPSARAGPGVPPWGCRGSIRLVLGIALGLLLATGSGTRGEADFQRAVDLLDNFQDAAAKKAFAAILASSPPKPLAARCHLYLGRIAIDRLEADTAAAEFLQALQLDPFIEPGTGMSPKGRVIFGQARQRFAQAALAAPPSAPGLRLPIADEAMMPMDTPENPSAAPAASVTGPEPRGSSRLPAYLTGAGGAVCLATAGILGWLSSQSVSAATGDRLGSAALQDLSSANSQALAADVLYGVAGAALVTSVILFFVEGPSSAASPSTP